MDKLIEILKRKLSVLVEDGSRVTLEPELLNEFEELIDGPISASRVDGSKSEDDQADWTTSCTTFCSP